MQFLLGVICGTLALCWFLQRLVVQSSYYADPKRWFCGTLEGFSALPGRISDKVAARFGKRSSRPYNYELKHYAGVKQFWLNPYKVPKCNQWADKRFKARRDEMASREAASKPNMPPVKMSYVAMFSALLVFAGAIAFFSLLI